MSSTPSNTRIVHVYDPFEDLERRYPDWELRSADLGDRQKEIILWPTKTIYVDRELFVQDPEFCAAHSLVHLDEHYGQQLPPEAHRYANEVAATRLDRPGTRPA